jgi:hypothetical protein
MHPCDSGAARGTLRRKRTTPGDSPRSASGPGGRARGRPLPILLAPPLPGRRPDPAGGHGRRKATTKKRRVGGSLSLSLSLGGSHRRGGSFIFRLLASVQADDGGRLDDDEPLASSSPRRRTRLEPTVGASRQSIVRSASHKNGGRRPDNYGSPRFDCATFGRLARPSSVVGAPDAPRQPRPLPR